jgi:hypothetical protein
MDIIRRLVGRRGFLGGSAVAVVAAATVPTATASAPLPPAPVPPIPVAPEIVRLTGRFIPKSQLDAETILSGVTSLLDERAREFESYVRLCRTQEFTPSISALKSVPTHTKARMMIKDSNARGDKWGRAYDFAKSELGLPISKRNSVTIDDIPKSIASMLMRL